MEEFLQTKKRARNIVSSSSSFSEKSLGTTSLTQINQAGYLSLDKGLQSILISAEVNALKKELEKERSLRRLERIETDNTVSKLKRYVLTLEKDAEDYRIMAEEIRSQSLNDLERASHAHERAVLDMRYFEKNLHHFEKQKEQNNLLKEDGDHDFALLKHKNILLEKRLLGLEEEAIALRDRLKKSQRHKFSKSQLCDLDKKRHINITSLKSQSKIKVELDTCDKLDMRVSHKIIKELNCTQVRLLESDCIIRKLKRSVADYKKKASEAIKYRGIAKRLQTSVEAMENELKYLRKEKEHLRVTELRCREFRMKLLSNKSSLSLVKDEIKDKSDTNTKIPPDIKTTLSKFQMLCNKEYELTCLSSRLKSQLESSTHHIKILENRNRFLIAKSKRWLLDKKLMQKDNSKIRKEMNTIYAREDIWKREADSLRDLLASYNYSKNRTEVSSLKTCHMSKNIDGDVLKTSDYVNLSALYISLQSAQNEIKILKEYHDILRKEKRSIEQRSKSSELEYNCVLKKFRMLRYQLLLERDRTEWAEKRFEEAEILAGNGFYNACKIRILHLEHNPLSKAVNNKFIKEILKVTKSLSCDKVRNDDIMDMKNIPMSAETKIPKSTLDAQKFSQRLKESFQKQIGLFREGVYLLTGYRIDMMASGTDPPRFIVRSMFSEQENDHLLMQWPKLDEGEMPSSLDILDTEMAQALSFEPSCSKYMTKYKSLPAFMASVTLALFERQTFSEAQ